MESINLTGSNIDIENDHIIDKTKKTYAITLVQLMIYLFDNNKEILSFKSSLIVANTEDAGRTSRKILRTECLKQFQKMNS